MFGLLAYDEDGKDLLAWKNLSTPENPIEGIMTGLKTFGALDAVSGIRLGTTVATNALLEGKRATVAYVTTRGFKDVPFIGRGNRRHLLGPGLGEAEAVRAAAACVSRSTSASGSRARRSSGLTKPGFGRSRETSHKGGGQDQCDSRSAAPLLSDAGSRAAQQGLGQRNERTCVTDPPAFVT